MRSYWDDLPAYDTPVETNISLALGNAQLAVGGDPMRTLLLFALAGPVTQTVTISLPVPIAYVLQSVNVTLPIVSISTSPTVQPGQGMILSTISNPLILTADKHGPLPTLAWYVVGGGTPGIQVTVITSRLRFNPDQPVTPNVLKEIDNGRFTWPFNGRPRRPGGAKLYGNSWVQRQKGAPFGIPYIDESGMAQPDGSGGG